jgi:arylsulfatase
MKRRQFIASGATGILGAGIARSLPVPESFIYAFGPENKGVKGPNILWIMLDDCRYDAIGCYGKPWVKTPHLDRIAAGGVRFDVAIVQNTVSVPSRRSMKTGLYAYEVGPMEMGKDPEIPMTYIDPGKWAKADDAPNLLDAWTRAGMKPVNFGKINGFDRSFYDRGDPDVLFNVLGAPTGYFKKIYGEDSRVLQAPRTFTRTYKWQIGGVLPVKPEDTETWRLGDEAVESLKNLLTEDSRFFMRVSFHAPHVPCFVPEEYYTDPANISLPLPTEEEMESKPDFEKGPLQTYCGADLTPEQIGISRGTYFGMLSLVDVQVGRLITELEKAGKLDNTIIAINSDQGFQLGEHGLWKKRVFYEANVRVPLIIRYPEKLPRGLSVMEPVEMIDFLPTLMELSGLEKPAGIRGESLMPLIRGERQKWRKACFSEIDHSQSMYNELRQGTGRRVMVRTKKWKLDYFMDSRVTEKDGALYDLVSDPGEQFNLYRNRKYRKVIADLEQLATEWTHGKSMLE